jgi:hypothetical protein
MKLCPECERGNDAAGVKTCNSCLHKLARPKFRPKRREFLLKGKE